jgi:hypothetical protein
MDLIFRRRAIFTGMRPYFDDHTLLDAINLWQSEYSQKPKFALSVFVARCCNSEVLKSERAKILKAIFMALELSPDELLPDPFIALQQKKTLSSENAEAHEAYQTTVFIKLLQQLFAKFNKDDEKSIRSFVIKHLAELETDKMRLMYIRDWFTMSAETLEGQHDLDVLQKLVNLCYMAMCELAGPVKADQFLGLAIKETEPLATEIGFRLHDLL